MAKRILIKWNWLMYTIIMLITGTVVMYTALVEGEIISDGWRDTDKKGAYRPYPISFQHGFAGGSNYTWNPDPNAKNQAEEQKKPTTVLNKYFKKYFRVNRSLQDLTIYPYLETIEFFDSNAYPTEQLMDRNSSVDTYKGGLLGDHYVIFGNITPDGRVYKRQEGDPGRADKVKIRSIRNDKEG